MINTIQDAVPWVMRELGYKQRQENIVPRVKHDDWVKPLPEKSKDGKNYWSVMWDYQALNHCLLLDTLVGVLKGRTPNLEMVLRIDSLTVQVFEVNGNRVFAWGNGGTIQEAALIATARALEVKHSDYRAARGILPLKPGQLMPEDAIRKVRDA